MHDFALLGGESVDVVVHGWRVDLELELPFVEAPVDFRCKGECIRRQVGNGLDFAEAVEAVGRLVKELLVVAGVVDEDLSVRKMRQAVIRFSELLEMVLAAGPSLELWVCRKGVFELGNLDTWSVAEVYILEFLAVSVLHVVELLHKLQPFGAIFGSLPQLLFNYFVEQLAPFALVTVPGSFSFEI